MSRFPHIPRRAALLAALLCSGAGACSKTVTSDGENGASQPGAASAPGVPAGWTAEEREDLRFGAWRFYRIEDPVGQSSVREDNLPVRDGVAMWGAAGAEAFVAEVGLLTDPGRLPPHILARQLAHWFLRGESRRPCQIQLAEPAPTAGLEGGAFVLRAWFDRGGSAEELTVTVHRDGTVGARWRRAP